MRLVINTNIIIGALIKDSLLRKIILSDIFELYAPEYMFEEILKHKKEILEKSGINDIVFTALIMLIEKHILLVPKAEYMKKLELAEKVMKKIDINDSVFIATSLTLNCSVWSDDKHFDSQSKVNIYKTKDIIKLIKL
ncbi:MAG: hypothetical protein BWK75_00600 [Candidatus Altiarchaeales archaeon A3]|nr:MAG: hypothetical protein BWK75_00600 [Candidatus Altiarchaeales archaeon A3]